MMNEDSKEPDHAISEEDNFTEEVFNEIDP
jgi:hypothetical protein